MVHFLGHCVEKKDDYDDDTVLATRGSINREAGDLYSDEEVLMEVHHSYTYGSV